MKTYGSVIFAVIVVLFLGIGTRLYKTVPPGHVAVATIFGKVKPEPYRAGLHIPVNPLYQWHLYDVRGKTHKETAQVPSQDQLQTAIEVSVQYRIVPETAPRMLKETGLARQAIQVHLIPKLRSLLREQGKSIVRAEDFFLETTQARLQEGLEVGLRAFLGPKGIDVQAALIRDITLPVFIKKAIEQKKEREQAVERQKAELERFRTEQQQRVAQATAEKHAAEQLAEQRMILADVQAYEIRQINEAVSDNPTYLQLRALDALKEMAKDPATKMYFFNSDSPNPLPLMHLGETRK